MIRTHGLHLRRWNSYGGRVYTYIRDWATGVTTQTSENNPIRVSWIDDPFSGRLGMTFLPGKQAEGISGRHDRTLATDAQALRDEWRIDLLVILVEDHELARFGVPDIQQVMASVGIDVLRLPIPDGGVPADVDQARVLARTILDRLAAGERVAVACRGGLGRTGTIAACTLIGAGLGPLQAIDVVRAARHGTIETDEQERFVSSFAL